MKLQQQAAEEKLRQAEQLAEEKRQRALITRVSIAAIIAHYYYSDHPQSGPWRLATYTTATYLCAV